MAQVVEQYLENSLEQIQKLKSLKLFTSDEINSIVNVRRQHEYSLQKRDRRLLDYDSYINSELYVYALIKLRRKKKSVYKHEDIIERPLIEHLIFLHRQMCYRFQSRVDLWIRYINFLHMLRKTKSMNQVWNRLLQVHGRSDPKLWVCAITSRLKYGVKAEVWNAISKNRSNRNAIKDMLKLNGKDNLGADKTDSKKMAFENASLVEVSASLSRESRVTYDRVLLSELRECRTILTRGISFNPESVLLVINLIKLELNCCCFFRERVLSYKEESEKSIECEKMDTSSEKPEKKKKVNMYKINKEKMKKEDAVSFLSLVTEDIDSVASGEAFQTVVEQSISKFPDSLQLFEFIKDFIANYKHLFKEEHIELVIKRYEDLKKIQSDANLKAQAGKELIFPEIKREDNLLALVEDIKNALKDHGRVAAIKLFDESPNQLWAVDPINNSKAILLLETRVDLDLNGEFDNIVSKNSARDNLRSLFEKLSSVSRWSTMSPELWVLYMKFENELGDFLKLTSIKWRALQTLSNDSFKEKFTSMLTELNL